MLIAILMYVGDEGNPRGLVPALMDALPSGSYLTITHPYPGVAPEGHPFGCRPGRVLLRGDGPQVLSLVLCGSKDRADDGSRHARRATDAN